VPAKEARARAEEAVLRIQGALVLAAGLSFAVDVLTCPRCQGRMKLLAILKPRKRRPLPGRGGRADRSAAPLAKARSAVLKSRVLRRQALGDPDACGGDAGGGDEPS
jgi:hypothetical protein